MNQFLRKAFFSLLLFIVYSFRSIAQSDGFEVLKSMELMDMIFQQLQMNYVDEIKPGEMNKTAIDAMLKQLDPYTVYYHEANIEDYRLMTTGQYGGVGATIQRIGDYCYFTEPFEGNPAFLAGIKAGDKILEIEGKSMYKLPSDQVSDNLKGPKGSTISVKVDRNGEEKSFSITRDEIKFPDVPFSGMIKNDIGYIKLNSFTQTAAEAVKTAFIELKSKGMTKLVFDLRGNGGGLLAQAVDIVNIFVPKGQLVVTTKGRIPEENKTYATRLEPIDVGIPIVVLVDNGSASASEIVAGTLQDLDRAVVVGQTSYGKGLVQRTFDLKYGSKIKLTISKYYTPSGRCVQKLEYYDKELGDKPKAIADSLIKSFTTKNGRKVIDGRGIEPDVLVEEEKYSALLSSLIVNHVLFDFATNYAKAHSGISEAKGFTLSTEEFQEFINFAMKREFTYTTTSQEELKKFKEKAEKEGYFEEIKTDYDVMLSKVTPSKEKDLLKFKDEINFILSNEIVSRYYFQKGRVEHSFQSDLEVKKGIEVLLNSAEYNKILGK
jgi:carboxyl-terminal processing protease